MRNPTPAKQVLSIFSNTLCRARVIREIASSSLIFADRPRLQKGPSSLGERPNAKTAYLTETVLSNKITRNRIVLSFKDSPRKPLGRRPSLYRPLKQNSRFARRQRRHCIQMGRCVFFPKIQNCTQVGLAKMFRTFCALKFSILRAV